MIPPHISLERSLSLPPPSLTSTDNLHSPSPTSSSSSTINSSVATPSPAPAHSKPPAGANGVGTGSSKKVLYPREVLGGRVKRKLGKGDGGARGQPRGDIVEAVEKITSSSASSTSPSASLTKNNNSAETSSSSPATAAQQSKASHSEHFRGHSSTGLEDEDKRKITTRQLLKHSNSFASSQKHLLLSNTSELTISKALLQYKESINRSRLYSSRNSEGSITRSARGLSSSSFNVSTSNMTVSAGAALGTTAFTSSAYISEMMYIYPPLLQHPNYY